MSKNISDIEARYKNRLIASVFQNINAALPHIERYYDDWDWKNEAVSSPAELLHESWEDLYAFISGHIPGKYRDDNPDYLCGEDDPIMRAVQDLNKNRKKYESDSLKLIEQEIELPSSL